MKLNTLIYIACATIFALSIIGCNNNKELKHDIHSEVNSVYYWNTVLELDKSERDFLHSNDVRRAYVRFFDIVVDKSPIAMDAVVPNATLQFKDTLPVEEVVPTIYITVDAIKKIESHEAEWAEKIVKRVFNMCSYNELGVPSEIQLDCDWTSKSDSTFFNLCREVKREMLLCNDKAILSTTIRLHQLSQTPPPVDYGVLMLYNTGSFENLEENNSILTTESVKPYLKYLADYPLHLDYAYPIFSWLLVYKDDHFRGILSTGKNISNDLLKSLGDNKYEVLRDTIIGNSNLWQGDMIRKEDVPFKTIMEVKLLIDKYSNGNQHSVILYNLDSKNLSNYTTNEFQQIYK